MASKPLIYTAHSKQSFYCRDAICEYVLRNSAVPLNPFRMFDYFLGDRIHRDLVREANRVVVSRSDEIWVFGSEIADGVLAELLQARDEGKRVRFFNVSASATEIHPIEPRQLSLEEGVSQALGVDNQYLIGLAHDVMACNQVAVGS